MTHVTRYSDLRSPRRSARALGSLQPDTRVRRRPWVGQCWRPWRRGGRRARRLPPWWPGAEGYLRPNILELRGPASCGKLGVALLWLAAASRGGLVAVVDQAGTFYPPAAAASGLDLERLVVVRPPDRRAATEAVSMLLSSAGFDAVLWPRGVEDPPDRPGLGEALDAGRPLHHDLAGAGDRSAAGGQQPRGRERRCRPPLPERGCSAPGDRLGVALAGWRAGWRPPAPPHRASAWGTGRPGVGVAVGAAPRHRRSGQPTGRCA